MADSDYHQNGFRPATPKSPREVERMVRRQLEDLGKVVWGSRLRLWNRYHVRGYAYPNGGYWWVSGPGDDGRSYQYDVVYEEPKGAFLIGHARGNIRTEAITAEALEEALQQAVEIGPIEQIHGSGYVS